MVSSMRRSRSFSERSVDSEGGTDTESSIVRLLIGDKIDFAGDHTITCNSDSGEKMEASSILSPGTEANSLSDRQICFQTMGFC